MEEEPKLKPADLADKTANSSPETTNSSRIQEGEWKKVIDDISPIDLAKSFEDEMINILQSKGYKCKRASREIKKTETIFQRTVERIFKGTKELKRPLKEIRGFRVRLKEVPEKILQQDGLIMAIAYEIEMTLDTRYKMHGGSLNCMLDFFTTATRFFKEEPKDVNLVDPAYYNFITKEQSKVLEVITIVDSYKIKKAQTQITENQTAIVDKSREGWKESMREKLKSMVSGGIPGLGKR